MAKTTAAVILLLFFFLLYSDSVYAHRMIIEIPETGVIRVFYDGEIPAVRASVQLWDSEDNMVLEGAVDNKGQFTYDEKLNVHKVVALDDFGHREVLIIGEEKREINRFQGALTGVSILLMIALIFHRLNKKNSKKV